MAAPSTEPGEFLGTERFVVRGRLGRGGVGVVYLATDRERGMDVALKTLRRPDARAITRFKREFRALADIAHPNLVALYELVAADDQLFFTMELLQGRDWLRYVRDEVPSGDVATQMDDVSGTFGAGAARSAAANVTSAALSTAPRIELTQSGATGLGPTRTSADSDSDLEATVAHLGPKAAPSPPHIPFVPRVLPPLPDLERLRESLRQLVEGLRALHAGGQLHRDIKPSNVTVTDDGRVVLLDFGIITELGGHRRHFHDVEIAGTPAYMAPEQADAVVTEASDWYSVGVMLYTALVGNPPFVGNFHSVLRTKQSLQAPRVDELRPAVPPALSDLCADLLKRRPEQRPGATEILERLLGPTTRSHNLPPSANEVQVPAAAAGSAIKVDSATRVDSTSVLVGRDEHRRTLRDALARVQRGEGQVVYVHGHSGMGKSALITEFLNEVARDSRAVLLEGRCYERESLPYKALDSLVDSLCQHLDQLSPDTCRTLIGEDVAHLATLFPVLRQIEVIEELSERSTHVLDQHEIRRRAFEALRDLLRRIGHDQPLVLYIDDLQWGDTDSAPILQGLMRRPDAPALLLVAAYRTEDVDRSALLRELLSSPQQHSTTIAVEPLSPQQAQRLAEELLRRLGADVAPAAGIAKESGGNPYFVHELVHAWNVDLTDGQKGPPSLDAVIAARVAALNKRAQRLVEIVAVAGKPLAQGAVQSAAQLAPEDWLPLSHMLRTAQLIKSTGDRSEDLVESYHDRIRETVAQQLPPDRLRRRHAWLVRALRETGHGDAETLSFHLEGAGEPHAAARYAVRAADDAMQALSFDHAAKLYRKALALGKHEPAKRLAMQQLLAEALANAGRGREAGDAYEEAAQQCSGETGLDLRGAAARQYLLGGYIDQGLERMSGVLGEVGLSIPSNSVSAIASLLYRRARLKVRGLHYTPRAPETIGLVDRLRVDLCWSTMHGLGLVESGRCARFAPLGLQLALDTGDVDQISRAMCLEGMILGAQGVTSSARVEEFTQRLDEIAEQSENPYTILTPRFLRTFVAVEQCRFRDSYRMIQEVVQELRRQTGVSWEIAASEFFWLTSVMYLGRLDELATQTPSRLADAEQRGDLYNSTNIRALLMPFIRLGADDPDGARQEAIAAVEQWGQPKRFHNQHFNAMNMLNHADLYEGNAHAAYERCRSNSRKVRTSLLLFALLPRGRWHYLRGMSAAACALDDPRNRRHLLSVADSAGKRLQAEQVAAYVGIGKTVCAGVAQIRGDHERAVELLVQGLNKLDEAGLALHAAAARRRLGQILGGDEGAKLISEAHQSMLRCGAKDPVRMTRTFAAGFDFD